MRVFHRCTKLMNPSIGEKKLAMIEQLVAIYFDAPNLNMALDNNSLYTVQHFLGKMQTHLSELKSPPSMGVARQKRKFGVWQLADSMDWKKMALGCEITGWNSRNTWFS